MRLFIWRHPRPINAAGICLGRTDLAIDTRKARRLAGRIQRFAHRHHLPKKIYVSPLQRSRLVGEILHSQGWELVREPALLEFDFGNWDGQPWHHIGKHAMDLWCADFAEHHPGKGESLSELFTRVELWLSGHPHGTRLAVGHAGWINAAIMLSQGKPVPRQPGHWPAPVNYGQLTELSP
ncbi:histidine phosphatase family protein [Zobellella aerophila]|uniref:Phosphoglycerate mutase n=1 Tax=Zobellella aerophila TaxID=870480 RepID=A0ABP6VGF1_9GAMM